MQIWSRTCWASSFAWDLAACFRVDFLAGGQHVDGCKHVWIVENGDWFRWINWEKRESRAAGEVFFTWNDRLTWQCLLVIWLFGVVEHQTQRQEGSVITGEFFSNFHCSIPSPLPMRHYFTGCLFAFWWLKCQRNPPRQCQPCCSLVTCLVFSELLSYEALA